MVAAVGDAETEGNRTAAGLRWHALVECEGLTRAVMNPCQPECLPQDKL